MIGFLTKTIQRGLVFAVYTMVILLVVAGSIRLINYSLCQKFYSQWLMEWETAINTFSSKGGQFPVFSDNNHLAYMAAVCEAMSELNITVPSSNTGYPFTYRHKVIGGAGSPARIFLLGLADRIVVYGLPESLFQWIDKAVDGRPGAHTGQFTGRPQQDRKTRSQPRVPKTLPPKSWTGVMRL